MSANVGYATLNIVPTTQGFGSALSGQITPTISAEGAKAGKAGGTSMGGAMFGAIKAFVAPMAAYFSGKAVIGFIGDTIREASGLNEAANAMNVVFGESAKRIDAIGNASARTFGLSKLQFDNMAVGFSNFAKNVAGPGGDVAGTIADLTGRAADFASVMNINVNDAADLFKSGLAGEMEPLRRYGIDLSAATIANYAYANGIAEAGTQLTEQQRVQAAYGSLMAQTSKVQGDFANTSDQLANRQRILAATWADLKGKLGAAFLPAMNAVAGFADTVLMPALSRAVDGIVKLVGSAGGLGSIFGGAFASIGPVLAQLAPQLSGAVGLFNPLSLVLKALAPLLPQIASLISTVATQVLSAIVPLLPMLTSLANLIVGALTQAFTALMPSVSQIIGMLGPLLGGIIQALVPIVTMLAQALMDVMPAVTSLIGPVVSVVQALMPLIGVVAQLITTLLPPLVQIFMALLQPILALIAPLVSALVPVLTAIANLIATAVVPWLTKLATWLGQIVTAVAPVIAALAGGLVTAIGAVVTWIARLAGNIAEFVVNAVAAFVRFAAAVGEKFAEVIGFVGSVPSRISGALGNVGNILYSAGKSIIDGFLNGIKSAFEAVKNFIGGIGSWIAQHKGPRAYDLGLLVPNGQWIMQGLRRGIENGLPALRATLGNVAATVQATTFGPPAAPARAVLTDRAASGDAAFPSTLVVVDADGALIGRMRIEAGRVSTGSVTPLDLGRAAW